MRNNFNNFRRLVGPLSILSFVFLSALLNTNMIGGNSDELPLMSIAELISSSRSLSVDIRKGNFSSVAKDILIEHKNVIVNYIAGKLLITNCSELRSADPTALTGVYKLYPSKDLAEGQLFHCDFQGEVVQQTPLKASAVVDPDCIKNNSCINQHHFSLYFDCKDTNQQGKTYCKVEGTYGTPQLVKGYNNLCLDINYGYDNNGFWVDNGCDGKFSMNRVPAADVSLSLITWTRLQGVSGYFIDVKGTVGGVMLEKKKCLALNKVTQSSVFDEKLVGEKNIYEFAYNGLCDDKTSIPIDSTTSARICFTISANQPVVCSDYQNLQDVTNFNIESLGPKNCGAIAHGQSVKRYSQARSGNCALAGRTFTCNNGVIPDFGIYRQSHCEER